MRTFLTLMLTAICVVGYAQKKPKINQALSALEAGNLAEAKSIIDAAIEHEKTMNDPKTWFYRGQIYASLDTANNEPGAMDEALKAFDKALELDPEQKAINTVDFSTGQVVNVDSKRQGYYAYYYNEAIEAYNAESFESAADNFETAFYINPADTNAILNAAYSASASGDADRAAENFVKSYDAGVRDKMVFLQLYNHHVKKEEYETALDMIRKGKETYPDDLELGRFEINLLIQLEKAGEAAKALEEAIAADPENPDLLFSLGVLLDESGDKAGAMESYEKAIIVDPNHFNSNFNKGVAMFNKANDLIKERNALSYKETAKNKELTQKINVELENALPVWEKLYSLRSTDEKVLETLGYIYSTLRMNDKAEKIQDELDAVRN